jgi:probable rRNA maturation factor
MNTARFNVVIASRQRTKKINLRRLRQTAVALLMETGVPSAELGINLVTADEMTRVNQTFLNHEGPTDIITFNHLNHEDAGLEPKGGLYGELFICIDEAVRQARQFRTTWQSELVRYVIHGVLHLVGYDDLKPALRRKMKREENRLLRLLAGKYQ